MKSNPFKEVFTPPPPIYPFPKDKGALGEQ